MTIDYSSLDRRLFETLWTKCQLDEVDGLYAANFICHHPPDEDIIGPEGIRQQISRTHGAYDQVRYTVEEHVVEGQISVTRWRMDGRVRQSVRGSAAAGQAVSTSAETRLSRDPQRPD